jgi:hypothetical protein
MANNVCLATMFVDDPGEELEISLLARPPLLFVLFRFRVVSPPELFHPFMWWQ